MLENRFKTKLIKEINARLPGSMCFHLDPNEYQGIPDILILYKKKWAMLEGKQHGRASKQPNQEWYVDHFNEMSFAKFISPENKEEVLNELVKALQS